MVVAKASTAVFAAVTLSCLANAANALPSLLSTVTGILGASKKSHTPPRYADSYEVRHLDCMASPLRAMAKTSRETAVQRSQTPDITLKKHLWSCADAIVHALQVSYNFTLPYEREYLPDGLT